MSDPADLPFSKQAQLKRPWNCRAGNDGCERTKPCRSCLGRRVRRRGQKDQRRGVRALENLYGVDAAQWRGLMANEENYNHLPVRTENKGGQAASVVATKFLASESQSEAARPVGDVRPFVATFIPPGWGENDGLIVIRLSKLPQVMATLIETWAAS